MPDLEVRELRYFRVVAEEGSLSQAAARLNMAQPPLSRAIAGLERRLGVRLFDRDNRGVSLTPAGTALLAESARVLNAVAAAAHRTRRAATAAPVLVVTAKPGIASSLLTRIVAAHRELPGAPKVEITVSGYGEQADLVRTGQVDLALIGSPMTVADLDTEPLVSEPRVAALPACHPLAERPAVSVADLSGLPMPQWPDATPDELDYWTGRDRIPVAEPVVGPAVRDSSQLIEVVALGQAVALVPESLSARNRRADVAYRPVPDASPYLIAVAWRAGARDSRIADFLRTATELTGSLADTA